ncbi:MAG: hypothetical protein LBQ77_04955 [Treponema sp.]|nr:hypothetical protein [Treponema sp.]
MTGACAVLESALANNPSSKEAVYALKCVNWWLKRIQQIDSIHDSYNKGGFLFTQWEPFSDFCKQLDGSYESCQYAVKYCIFSTILRFFQDVLGSDSNQHDPELLLQVSRCYKGMGNYDLALKYVQQAVRFKREDGGALSELADVQALLGESRISKALFREAFFLDPQGVNLHSLESELILSIVKQVYALGHTGATVAEWIPVYGSLFGIFSVKRALKSIEVSRLKQSILNLEGDIRTNKGDLTLIKPRLINRYFWLMDQYEEEPNIIEETMLKIKAIDPLIYERYQN